jgi:hypothetical protein
MDTVTASRFDQNEAIATYAAALWFGNAKKHRPSYGGINCVTACLKDIECDFRGQRM